MKKTFGVVKIEWVLN